MSNAQVISEKNKTSTVNYKFQTVKQHPSLAPTMNMRLHWGSFSVASIMNSSTVCEGWRVRNLIRGSLKGLPAWKTRGESCTSRGSEASLVQ